jgi:hypothetical protein
VGPPTKGADFLGLLGILAEQVESLLLFQKQHKLKEKMAQNAKRLQKRNSERKKERERDFEAPMANIRPAGMAVAASAAAAPAAPVIEEVLDTPEIGQCAAPSCMKQSRTLRKGRPHCPSPYFKLICSESCSSSEWSIMHYDCFTSVMAEAKEAKKALPGVACDLPPWSTAPWNRDDAAMEKLP